jgi:60 kDa SS-A/Ro ribonucleoprotein
MRTNVASQKALLYTHEGAVAVFIDPIHQLRRSVMANMLFENQFYEDGQSIADRIQDEVAKVLKQKDGPKTLVEIAVEARTQMKLRHVPLLLLVALIRESTKATRAVVADAITRVVQRPDEMGELISLYWQEEGKPKKLPLTAQMKKGLAAAYQKFDAYALGKWNSDSASIKLRDVLFLVHAKPQGEAQAEVWKKLADKKLESPDTWEVALSAGADKKETFTRLLKEEKLGALALLRNLRNMQQAGVDEETIRQGLGKMKVERVLPFRFITAARYAPKLEPQLEASMLKCLGDHEKLAGKTVLVVDNSGSMDAKVSAKSEIMRNDAACALAMLLREICDEVQIIVFSNEAVLVPPRRGFALRDVILRATPHGGTNTETALQKAAQEGYDRCIVITDEQSHQSISGPVKDKKGYFINVASYQNGIGYKQWVHIDGWSEAVLEYVLQYERFNNETLTSPGEPETIN